MNRREFMAASVASVALGTMQGIAMEAKPLKVGLIGAGWYGKFDLLCLMQVAPVEVVSVCDVDNVMLEGAAKLIAERQASGRKPRVYGDYRQLLAESSLDIVVIGTQDHWHALATIAAVAAGADVYVEKPISVDIAEGEAMVAAARAHQRVVQVGTQRRSTAHLIDARETIVKQGKLGKVALAETYCYHHMRASENPPDVPPPSTLDYQMWTGPAPMRPYCRLTHPRGWRGFMEYGNGIIGDMGVHMFDLTRWMLDLGWPSSVASTGGIWVDKAAKANITDTQTATFNYDSLQVIWQHRTWGQWADPDDPWGATLYGDKGTLKLSITGYDFTPLGGKTVHVDQKLEPRTDKAFKGIPGYDVEVAPAVRNHMRDFLKAVASRGKPVADIEQGHISTASCILANLSMKTGRTLAYDPAKKQIMEDEEANKLLRRSYRAPWIHPEGPSA